MYPGAELPWIRSGMVSPDGTGAGATRGTTKQIIVDTDAPLNAVSYQIISTKGRFEGAQEYTKGPKLPRLQGKVDYRISGRDFALKMQSTSAGLAWSFGKGLITINQRGGTQADPKGVSVPPVPPGFG
jgi:hypothetical protein